MNILSLLKSIFSLDTLIYLAIVLVFLAALVRCVLPLSRMAARLRRASRTIGTEHRQNKEKKSWNDLHFLGDRLQGTWTDFLQNAELRDAHGGSCDVTEYINEDTIIYATGGTRLAELTPGILVSLGILGTFLGLVMGLSGLTLSASDTSTLLAGMEKLIAGMSTAFLTSIAGVVASIAFNLLNNHYVGKCEKIFWQKGTPLQALQLYYATEDGKCSDTPLDVNVGKSYLTVVDLDDAENFVHSAANAG